MRNRMDQVNGNGNRNGVPSVSKISGTPQPGVSAGTEHRRDATDLDEVSIRLWNAYNDLATREDEFLSAVTALATERKKSYASGQAELRSRFKMTPPPWTIRTRPDGSRELSWREAPEKPVTKTAEPIEPTEPTDATTTPAVTTEKPVEK